MYARFNDNVKQAKQALGTSTQGDGTLKKHKEGTKNHEGQVRQGINVILKEPIYKLLTRIRDMPYYKKPLLLGEYPKKYNQRWKCAFNEEKGHKIENCKALKIFLDQLIQAGHLKDFADQEKTKGDKAKVRPNPRVD